MHTYYQWLVLWCSIGFALAEVQGGETLPAIVAAAHERPEFLGDAGAFPSGMNFSRVYKPFLPTWYDRLGSFIYRSSSEKQIARLEGLLSQVVTAREAQGYGQQHVELLQHQAGDKIVVWGDLFGAYHSFVRGLEELQRQEIIDATLNIVNPQYTIVLNANLLGTAPWNAELLEIVLALMTSNPDRVIYVRGLHEEYDFWTDRSLMRQLAMLIGTEGSVFGTRTRSQRFEKIEQLLRRFYMTLPVALYLDFPADRTSAKPVNEHQLVEPRLIEPGLIEFLGSWRRKLPWNVAELASFLEKPTDARITVVPVPVSAQKKLDAVNAPRVRALILSPTQFLDFKPIFGLSLQEPIGQAMVWGIFSAPTELYRTLYNFRYDAFCRLSLGQTLDEATITLVHRNEETGGAFQEKPALYLTTGLPVSEQMSPEFAVANRVDIGVTLDFSSGVSVLGKTLRRGARACLLQERSLMVAKQTAEKYLYYVFFDDRGMVRLAAQNVELLAKDVQTSFIAFSLYPELLMRYASEIEQLKKLFLFPLMVSSALRSERMKGLVTWRPPVQAELQALITHAVQNASGKTYGIVYYGDEAGLSMRDAAHTLLQQQGITSIVDVPCTRSDLHLDLQRALLAEKSVDALIVCTYPNTARALFQQLGAQELAGVSLYGTSLLSDSSFRSFLRRFGYSMVIAQVVPDPRTSDLAIAQEYRQVMDGLEVSYNPTSFEAYIATSVLSDVVRKLSGEVTPATVLAVFESMKSYQYKGLTLTFNAQQRDLGQPVYLNSGEGW